MEVLKFLTGGVGLIVAIVILYAVVMSIVRSKDKMPNVMHGIGAIIAILIAVLGFSISDSFGQVDAGTLGLQTSMGKFTGTIFQPGMFMTTPVVTGVRIVDVGNQHQELPKQIMLTKDQQSVPVDASINFNLSQNPKALITTTQFIGDNYYDKAIESQFVAALKAVIANYTFAQINTNLDKITNEVATDTERRVRQIQYTDAIQIQQVSIKQITPSQDLADAIERKVVAQQDAQTALVKKSQAQYEADQKVITAQGNARAQAAQGRTLTGEYLKLKELENQQAAIDKWDGHLAPFTSNPFGSTTSMGGNTILDARSLMSGLSLGKDDSK